MAEIKKHFDKTKKYTPWYARFEGQRKFFKTEASLDQAIADYNAGKPDVLLSARQLAEWQRCTELLPPGTSMIHVVTHFLQTAEPHRTMLVKDAVKDYLESREKEPGLRPRYLENLRFYVKRISEDLGEKMLGQMDAHTIESWCRDRGGAYSQHSARRHISLVFSYCLRRGWMKHNPAAGKAIHLAKLERSTPGFLSLGNVQKILNVFPTSRIRRKIQAAVAIQLFTGLRTEEVLRLSWKNISVGKYIDVPIEVSKTKERRVIDWWSPNLTACLGETKTEGLVAPAGYINSRTRLLREAGVNPPANAFRHSFATYGTALFQNSAKVALMLGHRDPDMLFNHYRNYTTEADGKKYFTLVPAVLKKKK